MIFVFSSAPDRKTASRIAGMLVESGAAACASIIKAEEATYMWKGKRVKSPEHLLIIKARKKNWKKIEKMITDVHPYSVPEVAGVEACKVSRKYLGWVYDGAVGKTPPAKKK